MGVSTDAIICFGIPVEEDAELPWDDNCDGDIEAWWREKVLGYKSPFEIFDEDGNWMNGVEAPQEKIDAWYAHRKEFDASSPKLPIRLVMHCSGEYPMWIIADEKAGMSARRGYVERIDVNQFHITPGRIEAIKKFVADYDIPTIGDADWYLVSLWF